MRTEIEIPAQHLPVLVTGDEGDLGNVKAGLKQAARRLVAQVVEVQIDDAERPAGPAEGGPE